MNFSDQTKLEKVSVNECRALTTMVFKNNPALKFLYMNGTGMQKLDISALSALEQFGGYGSKLMAAKFPENAKEPERGISSKQFTRCLRIRRYIRHCQR